MSVSLKIKIFDNDGTRVLQMAKSTLTIGSAAHCDVVLEHKTIHPEHVRAWLEGGRIWVQDLGGTSGTSLNDIRLPALKPMLVRELDVLRLGESEATLNLEALTVRAPVVKQPAAAQSRTAAPAPTTVEAAPTPESLEVSKRREELEKLGRELAEVRLQLQVAKLDRDSDQERVSQVVSLREEVKNVREQQGKWAESLKQVESEKQALRKKAESEISEFKMRLQADLKAMRDQDEARHLEAKKAAVTELSLEIRNLSNQKVRSWATRPLSQDMILEWEGDLNGLLRKQLLGEVAAHAEPTPVTTQKFEKNKKASAAKEINEQVLTETAKIRIRKMANKVKEGGTSWKRAGRASLFGLGLVIVLFGVGRYMKMHGTAQNLSSQAPMAHAPASIPTHLVLRQSNKYRATYTENVLYLQGYMNTEQNPAFHAHYVSELLQTATDDWKMNQWNLTPVMGKEQVLLQDLARLSSAMTNENQNEVSAQMRAREAQFNKDLEAALQGPAGAEKFMKFKRDFYLHNAKL